jgi:hypothetical protein
MRLHQVCLAIAVAVFTSRAYGTVAETRQLIVPTAGASVLIGFSSGLAGDVAALGAPGGRAQAGEAFLMNVNNGSVIRSLVPATRRTDDFFGFDLDINRNHVIVGDPANPSVVNPLPGAVYVFNPLTGVQQHRVQPHDSLGGDEFGFGTSLDNRTMLIGAPALGERRGRAYLFDVATGEELHRLMPNDGFIGDEFGWDVSLSGRYAVVGAPATFDEGVDTIVRRGRSYVFDAVTGQQLFKLTPNESREGDEFGFSIAASGSKAIIGAPDGAVGNGSAYLFDLTTGQQLSRLRPDMPRESDDFGSAVEIDGNVAVVGARGQNDVPGAVYAFNIHTGQQIAMLVASDLTDTDNFGTAVSIQGNRVLVGSPRHDDPQFNSGAGYVFTIPLPGDFDQDGRLAVNDLELLKDAVLSGANAPAFDVNNDRLVNQTDREMWVEVLSNTFFGDANLDGQFDSGDLVAVFVAAEYEDAIADNSTWAEGDWNGDCDFDTSDLILAFQKGAYERGIRAAVQAVPEGTGLMIPLLIFIGAARRRWLG